MTNYSLKDNMTCEFCSNYIKNCADCSWSGYETFCKKCVNEFYLSQDNKSCLSCDQIIPGCFKCNKNECTFCDSTFFFNETVINGSCVCQNGYAL